MTEPVQEDNDIVIICAKRTPIGKATKGSFKNTPPDELLFQLLKGCFENIMKNKELYFKNHVTNYNSHTINNYDDNYNDYIHTGIYQHDNLSDENLIDEKLVSLIDEIVMGNVLLPQGGVTEGRIAAIRAGIPIRVPFMTVNRQCASGLESVKIVGERIRSGDVRVGIAGGFEVMSVSMLVTNFYTSYSVENILSEIDVTSKMKCNDHARNCLLPMGMTSENLGSKFNLTRKEVDEYAYESHKRAFEAQAQNKFDNEIVPIEINGKLIKDDDGIRRPCYEKLKKLKPCFIDNGVSTAGNSSQLSDGASAIFLTNRKLANDFNFSIKGRYLDCVSVGCDPAIMGIGPVYAIRKLLKNNNLCVSDIVLFEINEAFGVQALYCIKELGINPEQCNVFGGAIALGHPLGATGGRLICTLFNAMEDRGRKGYCVVSLCVGTGMGIAGLFYKE